jgi:outer membrane receptor for ferric coprogen and ferric-rhodotorulic acid
MREFNRAQGNIGYADRETGAWMGVAQAFLFQDRLVGTFGYRKDRLKNWVGVARRDPAGEAVAPNTGVWTPVDPRTATPIVFNGQTRTLGGVLHLTRWASVFFNTSNSVSTPGTNYITPANPRQTTQAELVPSPAGKTTDYGVKLSLLRNRLFLTATTFHTVSQREFGFSGFNKGNPVNIWNALANSGGLNAEETAFARRQAEVMNQVQGYTQDSESKGLELEVVGRLTEAWSLSVNYSKNKTTRTNIAPEYRAYLDHHKAYWKKYADYSITQNANTPGIDFAPSAVNWNTPAVIATTGDFTANTDSINEAIADAEQLFFDNPHVFEGKRFVGDPLHNLNLRTRYDFRTGRLKGLSVGGGTRLRLGRVAGARTDYTITPGSDFTDQWNGRTIDKVTTVDAKDQHVYDLQVSYNVPLSDRRFRWAVQLNVNNLLDQRELIVNNVHPRTLAPITYRYQDPRQFILTNTVSF